MQQVASDVQQASRLSPAEQEKADQLSDEEAASAIAALVRELNAQSMKDMGRVMAALKQRYAGTMDFAKASAKVKELLTSPKG